MNLAKKREFCSMKINKARYCRSLGGLTTLALAVLLLSTLFGCMKIQPQPSESLQPATERIESSKGYEQLSQDTHTVIDKDKGRINALAFSPNGKQLAVASSKGLWIYDTTADTPPTALTGHEGEVLAVAWSNNETLASGGEDKTVRLWNVKTGDLLLDPLKGHEGKVNALAFSPDGRMLASSSESKKDRFILAREILAGELPDDLNNFDRTIRLWNPDTGKLLWTSDGKATTLAFYKDGKTYLVSASSSRYREGFYRDFWNIRSGCLNDFKSTVECGEDNSESGSSGTERTDFVLTPDGTKLAHVRMRVHYHFGKDKKYDNVRVKITTDSDDDPIYINVESLVKAMAFSPDGNYLATAGKTATIQLWDVKTKQPLKRQSLTVRTDGITTLAFSKNGMLASGSRDGEIALWKPK